MLARVLALGCRNCESHHLFLSLRKCLKTILFVWKMGLKVPSAGSLAKPARDDFRRGGAENCKEVGPYRRQDEGRQLQVRILLCLKVLATPRELGRMQVKTFRAEVLANMDDAGSAYTSKDMFAGSKADVDFVQVWADKASQLEVLFWPWSIHLIDFVRRCLLQSTQDQTSRSRRSHTSSL